MKRPRQVEIDWQGLERAVERFDPAWEADTLPYLNLRTGKVAYFGQDKGVDLADTLDFDCHVALSLPAPALAERRARMRAFTATVAEAALSDKLRDILSQEGGISLFYDLLGEHPAIAVRWQRVEAPRTRELIEEWLRLEQLITSTPPPWARLTPIP